MNIAMRGTYEEGTLDLIRRLVPPGGTFIDVGANIGLMSVYAAKHAGPEGRVLAFEPDTINFARLSWARNANEVPALLPFPVALGARPGWVRLFRDPRGDGGLSSLQPLEGFAAGEVVGVSTLEAITSALNIERIDLIKIDVEGGEYGVISGALELCRQTKPAIVMEMINLSAVEAGRLLEGIGYRGFKTIGKGAESTTMLEPSVSRLLDHDNMLFIHSEQAADLSGLGLKISHLT